MGIYLDAYNRWVDDLENAYAHRVQGTTALTAFGTVYVDSFADARAAMGHLGNAIQHILNAITDLTYYPIKTDHEARLHKKWAEIIDSPPWNGAEYELTWKKIMIAWEGISDPAMMWTITAIDQMRQHIWHKNPRIKWDENPFE